MKSIITIQFIEINGVKVDEDLLKRTPFLKISTKSTQNILCKQIQRYFKDNKIIVKTKGELIYE